MRTIEMAPAYQLANDDRRRTRKRRLLLGAGVLLLLLAATTLFAPLLIKRGVSAWLYYEARRSGLRVSFTEIRAPLLRPVEIHDLRIIGAGVHGAHFELRAPQVEAGLSFAAMLGQSSGTHRLRSVRIEHARLLVRGRPDRSAEALDWAALGSLVPDRFDLSADQVLFAQPLTRLEIRDAKITGSKEQPGNVSIASLEIRAPLLHKQFADVRGVTRWQNDQITVASLHLLDGLTIDSIGFDLAHLSAARVGIELGATIFGGTIRVSLGTDRPGQTRLWEMAATASGVALAQLTTALGMTEQVHGSLHAMKFTFHGDPRDLLHANGAIWTELTGFEWRQRRADVIMLGASLYAQTIQLQQLYVKQRANELTVSGETKLSADWLNPDFRGDISASVNDLGQLAELLGGSGSAFGGRIAARGRVHAYERQVDGELVVTGDDLTLLRNPVDSLTARLVMDRDYLRLEECQLRRADDSLQASGRLDLREQRTFEISGKISVSDLGKYGLGKHWLGGGRLSGEVHASGTTADFQADLNAELNQLTCQANTRCYNGSVAVESLKLATGNAMAGLNGSVTFPHGKLRASFSTKDQLRFDHPFDEATCLRGVQISTGESGFPFSSLEIEQDRLVLGGAGDGRTVNLCGKKHQTSAPARINIAPTKQPTQPQVP